MRIKQLNGPLNPGYSITITNFPLGIIFKHLKFWPKKYKGSYEPMHTEMRFINKDPGKSKNNMITSL